MRVRSVRNRDLKRRHRTRTREVRRDSERASPSARRHRPGRVLRGKKVEDDRAARAEPPPLACGADVPTAIHAFASSKRPSRAPPRGRRSNRSFATSSATSSFGWPTRGRSGPRGGRGRRDDPMRGNPGPGNQGRRRRQGLTPRCQLEGWATGHLTRRGAARAGGWGSSPTVGWLGRGIAGSGARPPAISRERAQRMTGRGVLLRWRCGGDRGGSPRRCRRCVTRSSGAAAAPGPPGRPRRSPSRRGAATRPIARGGRLASLQIACTRPRIRAAALIGALRSVWARARAPHAAPLRRHGRGGAPPGALGRSVGRAAAWFEASTCGVPPSRGCGGRRRARGAPRVRSVRDFGAPLSELALRTGRRGPTRRRRSTEAPATSPSSSARWRTAPTAGSTLLPSTPPCPRGRPPQRPNPRIPPPPRSRPRGGAGRGVRSASPRVLCGRVVAATTSRHVAAARILAAASSTASRGRRDRRLHRPQPMRYRIGLIPEPGPRPRACGCGPRRASSRRRPPPRRRRGVIASQTDETTHDGERDGPGSVVVFRRFQRRPPGHGGFYLASLVVSSARSVWTWRRCARARARRGPAAAACARVGRLRPSTMPARRSTGRGSRAASPRMSTRVHVASCPRDVEAEGLQHGRLRRQSRADRRAPHAPRAGVVRVRCRVRECFRSSACAGRRAADAAARPPSSHRPARTRFRCRPSRGRGPRRPRDAPRRAEKPARARRAAFFRLPRRVRGPSSASAPHRHRGAHAERALALRILEFDEASTAAALDAVRIASATTAR